MPVERRDLEEIILEEYCRKRRDEEEEGLDGIKLISIGMIVMGTAMILYAIFLYLRQ